MKNQFYNVGLRALTLAIKFLLVLSLAIFLPPEKVGLYGLITVTVTYSIYFVGFEFYTYSTRDLIARPKNQWPRLISTELIFFGIMYLIVLPLLSLVFIFGFLPLELMAALLVLIVLEHLSAELMRLLVVIEKQLISTLIIFVKQALWAICFIIAMWFSPEFRSIEMLLLFWISGVIAAIAIGVIPLTRLDWKGRRRSPDWKWMRRGLSVALPLLVSSVAARSLFTFDRYAFEAFNSLALLGAYSVYITIASAMLAFMESGVFVFHYPRMMKACKNGDVVGFESAYGKLKKQSLAWVLILVACLTIVTPVVFSMLEEKIYVHNIQLFYVILVAISVYIFGYVYQYALYTTSQDRSIIIANVMGLIIAIVVLTVVGPYTKYWAVTIAMVSGSVVAAAIKYKMWIISRPS